MKPWRAAGLLSAFIWAAVAGVPAEEQAGKTVYEVMKLEKFGGFEGTLDGFIHRLSGGVHMKLIAEVSEDDLDIRSETVEFSYGDQEDKIPDVIVFEGNVRFAHQSGTVRAEKATVNMQTKEVLFTGDVTADLSQIRGAEVEWIRMNLDTGDVVAGPGKVREIRLRSEDSAPVSENSADRN
ncbi:MAG: hypothetical protein QGD90_05110 [Candidatus Hydrogenedentes bacterium]|nr:hypothetical protein [Candidatus Hydrogenedentota bacterium]